MPFWDEMSLIDNNCWILEPIEPKKTDFYRRINLNVNNVSMNIKVDPRNPKEIPGCYFILLISYWFSFSNFLPFLFE